MKKTGIIIIGLAMIFSMVALPCKAYAADNAAVAVVRAAVTYLSEHPFIEGLVQDNFRWLIDGVGGFRYDPDKDIYYNREDDFLHKNGGFGDFYGAAAPLIGYNIDEINVVFQYKVGTAPKQEWSIRFWKGLYLCDTTVGGEIGVYHRKVTPFMIPYRTGENKKSWDKNWLIFFRTAKKDYEMRFSFVLYDKNSGIILDRHTNDYTADGKDWWIIAMRLGEFHEKEDLTMECSVELLNAGMAAAFKNALLSQSARQPRGRVQDVKIESNRVSFTWPAQTDSGLR